MSDMPDLNGSWAGEYRQFQRPHPIRATFAQEGNRFTGTMRDVENDSEMSVTDLATDAGMVPGADEKIEALIREILPDAAEGPIRFVTHLPEVSALSGSLRGRWVEFVKTYDGTSAGGFQVGDWFVEDHEVSGQSVHYSGTLSPDGTEIEGRWRIDADPEAGTTRAEGSFTLRREVDPH